MMLIGRLSKETGTWWAANKKFQVFYWGSSAVAALASYALATYMGQLSEG
jgi:hypothetical protein